ncbi:MAG TPA: alpha-amylase family glycosyl hydrolase [Saprospiraceae bacterium]|nr:alpha-amylase family glycosyl hydrolase [Saprospiraceae bacterium]
MLASSLLATVSTSGQSFTDEQKLQGYALFGEKLTFIFDESHYKVSPQRVFVTGEFRNWDANTDHPNWLLQKTGEQWLLTLNNADFAIIRPNTKFKFRINDGDWMTPPAGAKNEKGGDLVFMEDYETLELKAELKNEYLIWAEINQNRPLHPSAYKITDAKGREIPVAGVLPNGARTTLIAPAEPLDKKRVYFLEIPDLQLKAHCSFDGWFRETYSTKELGANIDEGKTSIRLFAPRAEKVKLYLYKGKDDDTAFRTEDLTQDAQGVWEIEILEDLHGIYYDFTIHGADDPGNHFYETNPVHINDPYARVSDDTWGKARIWRKTQPASPLKNGIPKMEDVIAYEVHVQDFTDRLPIDQPLKGTFKGMITPGLKNQRGEKIGFDYLLDLGINTVHLMPVQEYLHFPDDDWKASFQNDEYMISQGVSEENYQWGYRTAFAFAVESRYRTKGQEPGVERDEFRDLVQAFHDKGIAVIIDIVPNHTAENMDGNFWFFNFNALDKLYYYRTRNFEHIGAYGNEVKTENRPMTQRWLIDQCRHYIEEFGIDGFRIDLAGQIDEQTLRALKVAIGEDKIVYGEAWIGSNDPDYENNPDWDWYKEDSPITFFQDDSRGAFKGPVFELKDKLRDRGWPGGKFDERMNVMRGLANKFGDDKSPTSGINYLDVHDNFALADQFGTHQFDGRYAVDQDEYKIAVTLLYTSLGPIVTHGGSEIMRSKAHAPLKEVVKVTNAGYKVYMHGYRDTYNHRTANQFLWETVGQTPNKANANDYANMYAFWKGMNAFRLSEYGKVFRVNQAVPDDYYQWITPGDESLLGYIVDNQVMVLLNAGQQSNTFSGIAIPEGNWKLIANTNEVNHLKGVNAPKGLMNIKGGKSVDIQMEATSLLIWVRE